MERLTERTTAGHGRIIGIKEESLAARLYKGEALKYFSAVERLSVYEDTEHTPDDLQMMIRSYDAIKSELTAYRNTGLTPEQIEAQQQEIDQLNKEMDDICVISAKRLKENDQLKAQAAELREALAWLKAISFSHEDDLAQWPAQDTREEIEHALSLGAGCDYHNPADTERINKLEQDYKDACKGRMIFFEEGASKNERIQALVADKDQQAGTIMRLEEALKRIATPLPYMQKEAEATGCVLDGIMAIELMKDPNYYRGIANKALYLLGGAEDGCDANQSDG